MNTTVSSSKTEIYTYCPNCDWMGDADDLYCLKCGTRLEQATRKSSNKSMNSQPTVITTETTKHEESPWNALLWSINNFISNPDNIRFVIIAFVFLVIVTSVEAFLTDILGQLTSSQIINNMTFNSPVYSIFIFMLMIMTAIPLIAFKILSSIYPTSSSPKREANKK